MDIKEAQERIRDQMTNFGMIVGDNKPVDAVIEAICNGYTLCKVQSAISGMNGLYTKIEEYATAGEVVSDCVEILKENCQ